MSSRCTSCDTIITRARSHCSSGADVALDVDDGVKLLEKIQLNFLQRTLRAVGTVHAHPALHQTQGHAASLPTSAVLPSTRARPRLCPALPASPCYPATLRRRIADQALSTAPSKSCARSHHNRRLYRMCALAVESERAPLIRTGRAHLVERRNVFLCQVAERPFRLPCPRSPRTQMMRSRSSKLLLATLESIAEIGDTPCVPSSCRVYMIR